MLIGGLKRVSHPSSRDHFSDLILREGIAQKRFHRARDPYGRRDVPLFVGVDQLVTVLPGKVFLIVVI